MKKQMSKEEIRDWVNRRVDDGTLRMILEEHVNRRGEVSSTMNRALQRKSCRGLVFCETGDLRQILEIENWPDECINYLITREVP